MRGHHSHDHDHTHPHAPSTFRSLVGVVTLTALIFAAELVAGMASGSLSLLADAAHMLSDSTGLIIALAAALISRKAASRHATYGYKRIEVLAAAINAGGVGIISAWIAIKAITRIGHTEHVTTGLMLAVASVGLMANTVSALILMRRQHDSMNLRGAYLHVLSDLFGSVAVITAGLVIHFTGFVAADTIASLAIACLILPRSAKLLIEATRVLLDHAPPHVDLGKIRACLLDIPGVQRVHDLHVWTVDGVELLASCHLVVPTRGADVQPFAILREATTRLKGLAIGHATIQIEGNTHKEHEETVHD